MSRHDPYVTLRQMIDFCEDAQEVLGNNDATDVADSVLVRLALSRALELIGEAANRLPDEIRDQHPQIPWRTMSNFRNVLIHGYDIVDYRIAVDVVRQDISAPCRATPRYRGRGAT